MTTPYTLNYHQAALQPSGIRYYTNLARQTPDCVMLTIGEPDLDTPENIKTAAMASLQAGRTHYAPNQGDLRLRQAIADYETRRGNPTTPDGVLVTAGATQALFTAFLAILNPGDEVIVPVPAFGLYESLCTIAGAKMVPLPVRNTRFQISKADLQERITPRTKAIVLNSPCNPTGVVLNQQSLDAVYEVIRSERIYVICDNVYNQLCYLDHCPDLTLRPDRRDRLILCQSFSKPYAMTGWRIGYLCCSEEILRHFLLLNAAEIAAVPTFIQDAALEALKTDTRPMAAIYRKRRDYVCQRLRSMGLHFPEPEGAFYVFVDIQKFGLSSEEFCTRMIREGGVAAVPGSCFGVEGYIRLSYCYSDEELEKGLDRMEAFIKTL